MVQVNIDMRVDEISSGFRDVSAGKHRAKLVDTKREDSRSSGEPMIVWDWEVIEGEDEGATIRSYTTLQPHALGGIKSHCEAFGYKDSLKTLDTERFHGKTAYLVVTTRQVESRETKEMITVSSVKSVLPDKGSAKATPPASGAKSARKDDMPF